MFNSIINALEALWDAFVYVLQTTWNYVQAGYVWMIGAVYAFILVSKEVGDFVGVLVVDISSATGALSVSPGNGVSGYITSPVGQALATANTFFPVQEVFVLLSAYTVVLLNMMLYRFIKSWIPTVA